LAATNDATTEEIARLRSVARDAQKDFAATLGDVTLGRLVFASGAYMLSLRADAGLTELYRARFEGTAPEVKVDGGNVTIRNRRWLWLAGWVKYSANIALNTNIPWQIEIRGGAAEVNADLRGLDLAELSVSSGMSSVELKLPVPSGT